LRVTTETGHMVGSTAN